MSEEEKPDGNWSKKSNLLEHLGLSPGEYRLYGRILAESRCGQKLFTEDERTAAKAIEVCPNTFRRWKHRLAAPFARIGGKPLIRIVRVPSKKNPLRMVDHLEVVDIWPEHRAFFEEKAKANRRLPVGLTTGLSQGKPSGSLPKGKALAKPSKGNPKPSTSPSVASKFEATRPHKLRRIEDALSENKDSWHLTTSGEASSFLNFEGLKKLGYAEDEAVILAEFNRRALLEGYRPVDKLTDEVYQALRRRATCGDVMDLDDLKGIMDDAKESGPPKRGHRTFVRMIHNIGW